MAIGITERDNVFAAAPYGGPTVHVAGAGLAGLAAAKYLADEGYRVTVFEKRDIAGGKVSSWQDDEGDWLESGLHVFFGAYRNLLAFMRETGLEDNLQWMPHALTFSAPGGKLSPLVFPARLPAPWHGLTAITRSRGVLTQVDKVRTGAAYPTISNETRTASLVIGRYCAADFVNAAAPTVLPCMSSLNE